MNNKITITNGKKPTLGQGNKREWHLTPGLMWALTGAAALIISILALLLLVIPQWSRVGVAREFDVAAAQDKLDSSKDYLKQLTELETNFEKLSALSLADLQAILPKEKNLPELLAQLEAMARQSGVAIQSVNISQAQAPSRNQQANAVKENYLKLQVQVEVTAYDYASFKEFIHILETSNRLIDVQTFTYQEDQDKHSLQFFTYYLQD